MEKAIGYARVSTPGQLKGTGLQRQADGIHDYVNDMGLELIEIYDEQISRSVRWEDRPVLSKVVKECQKHGATLIVEAHDRLHDFHNTIPVKVIYTSKLEGKLMDTLGDLIQTYNEESDLQRRDKCKECNPLGSGIQTCEYHEGFAAGLEAAIFNSRKSSSHRTQAGIQIAKDRGKRLGKPPVGFAVESGKLKPLTDDPKYHLGLRALGMLDEGMTMVAVAEVFNDEGLKATQGGKWWPSQIKNLVKGHQEYRRLSESTRMY